MLVSPAYTTNKIPNIYKKYFENPFLCDPKNKIEKKSDILYLKQVK